MQRTDSGLVVSPTDLTKFLACAHLTALDLQVANGQRSRPYSKTDEMLELLFEKGRDHEAKYLNLLKATRQVTEIEQDGKSRTARAADTEAAMRAGAEVIYQAAFLHDGRVGYADFLLRVDGRDSTFGNWSYDVADTKLARRLKVAALLQMATYGEHLRRIQAHPPQTLTVVAGDGVEHPFPFAHVEAYARRVTARFDQFVAASAPTIAEPVEQCTQCRWAAECNNAWRGADYLSFVAFLGRRQRNLFADARITTMAALAGASADNLPRAISRDTRGRLVRQAQLQVRERTTGEPCYELLDPKANLGLLSLPEPDPADLYLDFESDRYVEPDGIEYLAGIGEANGTFSMLWAHSAEQEKALVETLIDRILAAWRANPGMHVYHYAPYEQSALKRLVARYGTREYELDVLLRAEVFVDLYAVVRQALLVSKESYSIKKLEAFYWADERRKNTEVAEAVSSMLEYEQWLQDRNQQHLDDVAAYNKDDVDSTRDLHRWLEQRRVELCELRGTDIPRRTPEEGKSYEPSEEELAERDLAERLLAADRPLLAGLVGWHRREARPEYWEFFRFGKLTDEELVDDAIAIGQLGAPEYRRDILRSKIWRYPFPPQETRLRAGDTVHNVQDRKAVGEVVDLDPAAGWIELKIGATRDAPTLLGLQPTGPIDAKAARASLRETGELVLAGGTNLPALLLDQVVPASLPTRPGETPEDALIRIGTALNGEVLAVQGPPGTGKSYNASTLIRALLDQGKTVGVTALSHAVIGGLLAKVDRPGLQRSTHEQWCGNPSIVCADDNKKFDKLRDDTQPKLIGGTAWLWTRDAMKDSVDVLVIDEAGQFSLADATAVARAAKSVVLLGDPQQLRSPTVAEHPHDAGVSALEYLIGEHDTIAAERGIFFDRTWRMHPDVNAFVSHIAYEDKLESHPSTVGQCIAGTGWFSGTGLRYVPVVHADNSTSSPEEAAVVAQIVDGLLGTAWTNEKGVTAPITAADVLIVAPYNVQVATLRDAMAGHVADGLRVGTVDKFQGKEGAVVIYSTASSSADDAPRGTDFLFDTHRLNVAISRARAMAIMVSSPTLLDVAASKPESIPLINAHCCFAEMATPVAVRVSIGLGSTTT